MSGDVPISELKELVDDWKYTLYTTPDERATREACANELQEVIDTYE